MPNALTKQTAASALVSARSAPTSGKFTRVRPGIERESEQQRLERQPFARETVQRRQARQWRARRRERTAPVHGIRRSRPPNPSMLPRAGRHDHAAGAEEQQSLEGRMIHHVVQARGDRHDRQFRSARRPHRHAGAEPEENDPRVLDRAVGQQPFQVVLRQRVEHAENRRERAEPHARSGPTRPPASRDRTRRPGRGRRCPP